MQTPRENFLETIRGGKPDRYLDQFEALAIVLPSPIYLRYPEPEYGKEPLQDPWGVWFAWPEGSPGPMPVQDSEHILIKDIDHWQDYVKMPDMNFSEEEWAPLIEEVEAIDRSQQLVTPIVWPGLFEKCHHMMGMEQAMVMLYEEPEIMHELIDLFVDYEIELAKGTIEHLHPDALFRHDDWGSRLNTFFSRDMFHEFFFEPTKRIYQFWKDNGVDIIVHHSDTYGQTLVPDMVDMGIDVWQGALTTNDIPMIAREYQGKLTIMGALEGSILDVPGWTPELVRTEVNRVLDWVDSPYLVPCVTGGFSTDDYIGVDMEITNALKDYNASKYCFK